MAQILSGKQVSLEIQERLRSEVTQLSVTPKLAILQVGNREDSNVYIRMKRKFAEEVGVLTDHISLPRSSTETEVIIN